jgi:hypothetical protein
MRLNEIQKKVLSRIESFFPEANIELVAQGDFGGDYIVITNTTTRLLLASGMSRKNVLREMSRRGITRGVMHTECQLEAGKMYQELGVNVFAVDTSYIESQSRSPDREFQEWLVGCRNQKKNPGNLYGDSITTYHSTANANY